MGKFIGVIAAALERRGEQFVQTTELLDFPDEVWVYYCRPHLGRPKPGWADLAAGTLRLSLTPPPFRHDRLEWQPNIAPAGDGAFEYAAEVMGVEPGNNLFHLALPPRMLPVPDSWDAPPLYGHADGARFVLGWSIAWNNETGGNQWPTFRFGPAAPEEFAARAEAIGRAIEYESRAWRPAVLSPWSPAEMPERAALHRKLDARLDEEGTRTLAFDLGIDYDNLAGRAKSGKLRELILFMERQSQLPRLVAHLQTHYAYVLAG
jgi:hypothetical protein